LVSKLLGGIILKEAANMRLMLMPCVSLLFLFFCSLSFADTVYLKDGKSLDGVVTDEKEDIIVLFMLSGKTVLKKEDIKNISYDTRENNLLLMAKISESEGGYAKAYYFYEKVLLLNPGSAQAIESIKKVEPYAMSKDIGKGWEDDYERFYAEKSEKATASILSDNAENTERLLREFGLILNSTSGDIIVRESVAGKKAYNAGIRSNDYIREVWGEKSDYQGLFDVVNTILNHQGTNKAIVIEREIIFWTGRMDTGNSMFDSFGFSLDRSTKSCIVSFIQETSSAGKAGLKKGDMIVAVNGFNCEDLLIHEIEQMLKRNNQSQISLIIQRKCFF
jgi:hypothetical protein